MKDSLLERFKSWWCEMFSHKPDYENIWIYNGYTHSCCKRCKKAITANYDMAYGCTYWE